MAGGESVFVDPTCWLNLTSKISRSSVAALSFPENKGWSVSGLRILDGFFLWLIDCNFVDNILEECFVNSASVWRN